MLKLLILCTALALSGCVVVPYGQHAKSCHLIKIALDEADMAPAWYTGAGDIVEACGDERGKAFGLWKMCGASKRNGFDVSPECVGVLD